MGAVDSAKIQVRSAYESGMEGIASPVLVEYVGNRGINIIKTKSLAFLIGAIIFAVEWRCVDKIKSWNH